MVARLPWKRPFVTPTPTRFIDLVRITARWAGECSHARTVLPTTSLLPLASARASPRRLNPPPADTRERCASTPRCIRKAAKQPDDPASEDERCSGRSPFLARAWLIFASIAPVAAALRAGAAGAVPGRASAIETSRQTVIAARRVRKPRRPLFSGLRG